MIRKNRISRRRLSYGSMFAIGDCTFGPSPFAARHETNAGIVFSESAPAQPGRSMTSKGYALPSEETKAAWTSRRALVIAVLLVSGFVENLDIEQALLGSEAWQFRVDAPESGQLVRQRY